jgi:hypothetical protein
LPLLRKRRLASQEFIQNHPKGQNIIRAIDSAVSVLGVRQFALIVKQIHLDHRDK